MLSAVSFAASSFAPPSGLAVVGAGCAPAAVLCESQHAAARMARVRQHYQGREVTAPPSMLVTLLTSHRERSLFKSEHW